ncbi:Lrp/AsnC family transcriptional regulator [Aestuariispira ectoiniformans]|uniref:Lrp/AsnC family transcriptional regulator n=1 Tax=Aestuariispira ectoiniformans TaxID=2775080 RepID=UPI00223B8FAB|nr:Lrp/AsnC family transcriptional regulator [Aestuariispira ectoiniformans]
MSELDETDRKILAELARNARLPITTLAARVGLSRTAVQHRLDRMERDGTIGGYTVRLGADTRVTPTAKQTAAFVEVKLKDRLRQGGVLAFLGRIAEVQKVHNVSGEGDLVVLLEDAPQDRIREICQQLWGHENVASTNTVFVLGTPVDHG